MIGDPDIVAGSTALNGFTLAPPSGRFDTLDISLGGSLEINRCSYLQAAWFVPVRGGTDRFFNSGILVSCIRRF
jgi:hypothetical protein